MASDRPDAWRCKNGNEIHDPCFRSRDGTQVACASDDGESSVVLLRLAKPLPTVGKATPVEKLTPWALQLSSGARCTYVVGATDVVAGMRLNYACSSGGWVLDYPSRTQPVWKAKYVKSAHDTIFTLVDVTQALF